MNQERTILQRIADGDEHAPEDCLRHYGGLIRAMGSSWFSQSQDVEDLAQDVFIELWRCAHRFDPNVAAESSFVKMVTRRQMINRLRRNGRRNDVPLLEGLDFASDPGISIEQSLDADRINQIIGDFRPDQRKVLSLFFKLGMSHGEISDTTRIALGTVKSYIRRGVIAIRERIEMGSSPALTT